MEQIVGRIELPLTLLYLATVMRVGVEVYEFFPHPVERRDVLKCQSRGGEVRLPVIESLDGPRNQQKFLAEMPFRDAGLEQGDGVKADSRCLPIHVRTARPMDGGFRSGAVAATSFSARI